MTAQQSNTIIQQKALELKFLERCLTNDYTLIDVDLIEEIEWTQLGQDDLKEIPERSMWQNNHHFYALRSDFTDQLLRYYKKFPPTFHKVAYSGVIVRNQQPTYQIGLEHYNPSVDEMKTAFQTFYDFIKHDLNDDIAYIVIGHYQLFKLLLQPHENTVENRQLIEKRDISELTTVLGSTHPVVRLLTTPTTDQLQLLSELFANDYPIIQALHRWVNWFREIGLVEIHLDITPIPPRSYYKGAFFKCYLEQDTTKRLIGGYYNDDKISGFGMGLKF